MCTHETSWHLRSGHMQAPVYILVEVTTDLERCMHSQ